MAIRPALLIIATLCITTFAQKSTIGSGVSVRHCSAYDRCKRDAGGNGILEGNSSMGYKEQLSSDQGAFIIGFFVRDTRAYLGIWYREHKDVVVWVANRDNPIPSRVLISCSLALRNGNAMVKDSYSGLIYWSTDSLNGPNNNTYLQFHGNGNLLLKDSISNGTLWQSFDHPTDTFLPGMVAANLTSWKSNTDPSTGNYILGVRERQGEVDEDGTSNIDLWLCNNTLRSSASCSARSLQISLPPLYHNLTPELLSKEGNSNSNLRLVMNATGSAQLWELSDTNEWSKLWWAPKDQCDSYQGCGNNGVCNAGNGFKCKCLPGYHPTDPAKWFKGESFSIGCSKNTEDQCRNVFVELPIVSLPFPPYSSIKTKDEKECRDNCLSQCGQKAYSFDANQSTCMIWKDGISHVQEEYYNNSNAHTLYIRLTPSDIESSTRTCDICGTNVIPYPLSTNSSCGDPAYLYFECNLTNGQVYFKPPSGRAYKLTLINHDERKFTLQLVSPITKCDSNYTNIMSKEFKLSNSSPFEVTSCRNVQLLLKTPVVEVELSWNPPLPPACNQLVDCSDWPKTTCGWDKNHGKKVCMCENGRWNSITMNCTEGNQKHLLLWMKLVIAFGSVLFLSSSIYMFVHYQRRETNRAGTIDQYKTDDIEDIDIPFIEYQNILAATDNFSDANKLGVGGFGPVYKGVLADGNEIAVKRLSEASMQGAQEFKNEILLIAKLQHRNLVRVIGYCISEVEKILIYEYMPNKSLDHFLFNQTAPSLLDWMKRFDIILGIARGLLYLHQDSRLRIVHRDLKPGNILLDEELIPKISDFGLAKIIAGNDMATNTARVVGTYGYMSPEYALEGYFSIKSDVYSFGIIVIEIISGRRCSSLVPLDSNLISLLGHAWILWTQGKELELVDKSITNTCDCSEVKRCINVALLCAQEDPSERPTMSNVLLVLSGDNMKLPYPKQPVFVARRHPSTTTNSSGTSLNVERTTTIEAR